MVNWINNFIEFVIIKNVYLLFLDEGEEDEEPQQAKPIENNNDDGEAEVEIKQTENLEVDADEAMPDAKNVNGSPDAETESQKDNIEADDSKELADGEIADLSGDESKQTNAPETIDLGKFKWQNISFDILLVTQNNDFNRFRFHFFFLLHF